MVALTIPLVLLLAANDHPWSRELIQSCPQLESSPDKEAKRRLAGVFEGFAELAGLGELKKAERCHDEDRQDMGWSPWPKEVMGGTNSNDGRYVNFILDKETIGRRTLDIASHVSAVPPAADAGVAESERRQRALAVAERALGRLFDRGMPIIESPEPEQGGSGKWLFRWRRSLGRYVFDRDAVAIRVGDSSEGSILLSYSMWHVHSDSLSEASFRSKHKLSSEQAMRFARTAALAEGADIGPGSWARHELQDGAGSKLVPVKEPLETVLRIVPYSLDGRRPGGGFECGAKLDYARPVLAYRVRWKMLTNTGKDIEHWWQVWVSAEDGSVVGCDWQF